MYYYNTPSLLLTLVIGSLMALIPAAIAKSKGRSFGLWWLYGFFLWLIAIIHVACLPNPNENRCEECTYRINENARMNARIYAEPTSLPPPSIIPNNDTEHQTAYFETRFVLNIECPVCNKIQKPNRNSCFSCGCHFIYGDQESGEPVEILQAIEQGTLLSSPALSEKGDISDEGLTPALEERRPRFCHKCGEPIVSIDSQFCRMCGTRVIEAQAAEYTEV